MGFSVRFFVALGVACVIRMTWAAECSIAPQNCDSGQYNAKNCQTGGLHQVLGYSCVACPDGYPESDVGTPQTINDCYKLENCKYYLGGQVADGEGYHVENNTCYSNTRACSDFSSLVYNFGQVTCLTQSGSAVWNSGKWDVSGCSCDVPSVSNNLNDYFRCAQFGTHVGLYPNQNVQSIGNSILYMMDRLYCEKCPAGYLPTITDASSGDIYARPENTSGNWGVITCGIQVQAPDYAPGCVINFNLSMDDMMAECRKTCPGGSVTESGGATDITQCIADYSQTYEDSTGFFVLTSFETCP